MSFISIIENTKNNIQDKVIDVSNNIINTIQVKRYGDSIVLGSRASGKTQFVNWICNRVILKDYLPTNNFYEIKNFTDSSGQEEDVKLWEEKIKKKNTIFYLFDVEKFLKNKKYTSSLKYSYKDIVINQISLLNEHFNSLVKDKKVIIVGTFEDKITSKMDVQKVISKIKEEVALGDTKIIIGSLIDQEKAQKLEDAIINIM
ncbi:hypothetical protein [Aliarcobacter butzleri]|uniref:hypothetical protein n=1 Tax=Aliarcobacter butzleri TaxID=28197 RepID=UPI001EE0B574|nr:hypothetical protein [Aliarcobacter butzleri]MCG3674459.1 hypothetical protein [Aliarcobacter butzleri]MCT7619502.1 hypothetical protein [Aliarcobacter butzleri]MDN5082517.1 hypothetical protein [Aliarcobacter butzleri]MDN5084466.1 hypothetical protein [Aliarcobacter butzleri]MDN5086390.1 hypothetical protein [Aliarcobacter butzleri]